MEHPEVKEKWQTAQPLQRGKIMEEITKLKIARLHRSKTSLLRVPTSLVIYLILLDVYVKLLN